MTFDHALALVVAVTHHERYRALCAEENPDRQERDSYRALVLQMAEQFQPTAERAAPEPYPGLWTQLVSVATAAAGFAASGFEMVDQAEHDRRLAICGACPHWDPSQGRCRKCGCVGRWKTAIAAQHCPDDPPRW
jgi:hypothetical protein